MNNTTKLGANFNPETNSVVFRLMSKNATAVILCIFDEPTDKKPVMNFDMKKNSDDIWETSVKIYALGNLKAPVYYGYRVFGNNWVREDDFKDGTYIGFKQIIDSEGNRFNPNKIAYDPYSKELSHFPSYSSYRTNESNFTVDNSKTATKSVFVLDKKIEKTSVYQNRALKDEIIGEVHIKDLSQKENLKEKGTYLGAAKMAKKLKDFGFTMIEFLPLHEFDSVGNHWGYMPLSYFALSKRYAFNKSPNSANEEFRQMIKAFHENGLKVCMDVVYNHTGEGGIYNNNIKDANLMSYALIDNQNYYKLKHNKAYTSNSACGNDFNISREMCQNLVIDSLEYFIHQGVDAFRFDLAVNLMDTNPSEEAVYDAQNGFLARIEEELRKRGIKINSPDEIGDGISLIAEPWTCGGRNSYQIGNFPPKWAQWNDIARNTIRANSLGFETDPLGLRNLIEGTPFKFKDEILGVNYVSCHDGFSLNDLNSYSKKTSYDGDEYEMCSDFGGVKRAQENSMRKQIALLMLSKGIVMMGVGDIIAHSKLGNNNSYNIDNDINYLDFSCLNDKNSRGYKICDFTKTMIAFRKKHKILSDKNYNKQLQYLQPNGTITLDDNKEYWENPNSNFLGFKVTGEDVLYCAISKDKFNIEITLPQNSQNKNWYLVSDTTEEAISLDGTKYESKNYTLKPNSLALFIER